MPQPTEPWESGGPTPVQKFVDRLRDEFVFDASDAALARWLDGRHRTMCVDSECLRAKVNLGVTDGTGTIAVPRWVIRMLEVTVGGATYKLIARRDLALLNSGMEYLTGSGSVFVSDANFLGEDEIALYPVPDAGLEVVGFASARPAPLELDGVVQVPNEYNEALLFGAAAVGLRVDPEQSGEADRLDALFYAAVQKLRKQTMRRMRSGPAQIRVQWP